MKPSSHLLLGLLLTTASCKNYSTVTEIRPTYRSATPAGERIAEAAKVTPKSAQEKIGGYLDAAAMAATVLETQPGNTQARADYNFALSRVFGIVHEAGLQPWKAPLPCPGAKQTWSLSMKAESRPERNPSNFSITPADTFQFKGSLVTKRTLKDGLGAPMVAVSQKIDPRKYDPFAQGKQIFYGITVVADFNGSACEATFLDPLARETVQLDGHTYPLAADFTAPIALALADLKPRKKELDGLFRPEEFASSIRLARLQPYDAKKIPILCVHGLGDSQATWAPLIQTLRGDATIRDHYQFWFFSYPTGYPYPLTASVLRQQLDAIKLRYPDQKKMVVIGHSMGGMITRTLMTDSGMKLWNSIYPKPPSQMPFSAETRKVMTESLIFKPRPEIARVIFASPSHRGADMATSFLGRLGSKIIGGPGGWLPVDEEALKLAKPNSTGEHLSRMPNSIDFLNPANRFVSTLAEIPVTPRIPFHTIIGDRGKGGNLSHAAPVSTDGIVPYWSSHLDGAKSEVIIPSHHWTNQHPQGIEEVRRILYLHLKQR